MASGAWDPRPTSNSPFKASVINSHQLTPINFLQLCCSLWQACSHRHGTARNANGYRPSRFTLFSVFTSLSKYFRVHRFGPNICGVVLAIPFLRANLARVYTCLKPQHRTLRMSNPSCVRSMVLLAELLSVPNTHCATFSPKLIIMLFTPSKIDALFDSCVEFRLSNTQTSCTLRPTSCFEYIAELRKRTRCI